VRATKIREAIEAREGENAGEKNRLPQNQV
jgi:hypothetical protein